MTDLRGGVSYVGFRSVKPHKSITDAPEEWVGHAAPKRNPPQTGCGFTSSATRRSNGTEKSRSRMVGLFLKVILLIEHLY